MDFFPKKIRIDDPARFSQFDQYHFRSLISYLKSKLPGLKNDNIEAYLAMQPGRLKQISYNNNNNITKAQVDHLWELFEKIADGKGEIFLNTFGDQENPISPTEQAKLDVIASLDEAGNAARLLPKGEILAKIRNFQGRLMTQVNLAEMRALQITIENCLCRLGDWVDFEARWHDTEDKKSEILLYTDLITALHNVRDQLQKIIEEYVFGLKPPKNKKKLNDVIIKPKETGGAHIEDVNQDMLVDRAIQGDLEAINCILGRHKDRIAKKISLMIDDPIEQEEVLQNTLINIFQGISKFEKRSSISTWIYVITINTIRLFMRGRKQSSNHTFLCSLTEQLEENEHILSKVPNDPEQILLLRERLNVIFSIIQFELSSFSWEVIRQRIENPGHSLDLTLELAKKCGLKLNTYKTRLYRARAFLKDEFEKWEKSDR